MRDHYPPFCIDFWSLDVELGCKMWKSGSKIEVTWAWKVVRATEIGRFLGEIDCKGKRLPKTHRLISAAPGETRRFYFWSLTRWSILWRISSKMCSFAYRTSCKSFKTPSYYWFHSFLQSYLTIHTIYLGNLPVCQIYHESKEPPPLYWNVRACVLFLFSSPIPLDLCQAQEPSPPPYIPTHIPQHYHCIGDLFQVVTHYSTCGTLYHSMVMYRTTRTTWDVKRGHILQHNLNHSSAGWSAGNLGPLCQPVQCNVCTTHKLFERNYGRFFLVTK